MLFKIPLNPRSAKKLEILPDKCFTCYSLLIWSELPFIVMQGTLIILYMITQWPHSIALVIVIAWRIHRPQNKYDFWLLFKTPTPSTAEQKWSQFIMHLFSQLAAAEAAQQQQNITYEAITSSV